MFNRNKKNRRNKNNKGFSLVELIVVIAIMAVLVAVLAPQFTKYIDQSRKSNDAATVSAIATAAQVGITDTTNYSINEAIYTITLTKDAGAKVKEGTNDLTADGSKNLADAIVATCGSLDKLKLTSANWKVNDNDPSEVVITVEYIGGTVAVTYSEAFATYTGAEKTTP